MYVALSGTIRECMNHYGPRLIFLNYLRFTKSALIDYFLLLLLALSGLFNIRTFLTSQ